ncbi:hypothetical protein Lalb_Chr08g0233511 [Lupinus albus]|uniref:Uncharacterized protein n=1 Tax=Lupinus albus TaxID=3870 RepID=A0A6A4P7I9_LUPAL|nr:hypothetical protein Lalb_Chr16g0390481 [Lupinus albus]KAE9608254.1 hypothetical protein Lalb_Chr08g0233511 [Lupinus albus]
MCTGKSCCCFVNVSNCGVWVWCNHRREEVLGCVEMSVRTLFHDVVAMSRGFKPLSKIIFGKT